MNGMIGKKIGMTQIFDDEGRQVPVTVIEAGPCRVVQVKTVERDGYQAVQLAFGEQKEQRLPRPLRGHYTKAEVGTHRFLREFSAGEDTVPAPGDTVTTAIFEGVSHVDVVAMTKGRGFQGVVKRHGMSGGRAGHGSGNHRTPGSIGQCVSPARVVKGKKLPGQMGHRRVTTQNLKVAQVRPEDHVILVRGAVPGPNGGLVLIYKSLKKVVSK